MLYTCNNIEIPAKPNKKLVNIILIDIFLHGIVEMPITPLVSSKIPDIKEVQKLKSCIPNNLKIGKMILANNSIILLFFKIESITLNKTTNPPIMTTVEIEEVILFPNISPRLEKFT